MYGRFGTEWDPVAARGWFYKTVSVRTWGVLRRNIAVAIGCFFAGAVMLVAGVHSNTGIEVALWQRLMTLALSCAALALRSRAPMAGLIIGTVAFAVELVLGLSVAVLAIYTDNIYSATVRGPRRAPRYLLIGYSVVCVAMGIASGWWSDIPTGIAIAAILAVVLLSPVATGIVVNDHRDRAALERDRAAKIAELAEVDRRAALAEERNRMARELHDTIANHFSAIAMQSSAVLSRTDMAPDAVRGVMASIRENSLAGLADMRHTIMVLRANDGTDDSVQHGIGDLGDLVDRMRAAGLTVALSINGEPHRIPVSVEFAGYRIVQEALTNALKHGRDAEVAVTYRTDRLDLTVTNRLSRHSTGVPGSGSGLDSMRERTSILGGVFFAGADGDRWRVTAELPIDHR